MMVSLMFFNLEIFVYLVMVVKCIDMDLLVKVDTALKYIILSKMMIVVWLYLRFFVHFLAVKYSWETQLLFLSAERKRVNKVFCLLLLLIDSLGIFATKLKSVPDGFRWRESSLKLMLGEI